MANKLWDVKRVALRETLKELRMNEGYTQDQLADSLSKPQSYVSKYESGERKLDFVDVLEVIDVLGVELVTMYGVFNKKLQP
ncbi:helix-turn-helix domain-containing protein [Colwellia sp. RE-S-Sl-9]